MATPAPDASTPPIDRRQLALDVGLTLGIGLLVVGWRLFNDQPTPQAFSFAGVGALAVAAALFGRDAPQRGPRVFAVLAAVAAVALSIAAIVV